MQEGTKPTITRGEFILRGVWRYIEGTDSTPIDVTNLTNMQIEVSSYCDNQLEILIHKGSDLEHNTAFTSQGTMDNNTPVALMIYDLEITFIQENV